jgi:hypothetical protein
MTFIRIGWCFSAELSDVVTSIGRIIYLLIRSKEINDVVEVGMWDDELDVDVF